MMGLGPHAAPAECWIMDQVIALCGTEVPPIVPPSPAHGGRGIAAMVEETPAPLHDHSLAEPSPPQVLEGCRATTTEDSSSRDGRSDVTTQAQLALWLHSDFGTGGRGRTGANDQDRQTGPTWPAFLDSAGSG